MCSHTGNVFLAPVSGLFPLKKAYIIKRGWASGTAEGSEKGQLARSKILSSARSQQHDWSTYTRLIPTHTHRTHVVLHSQDDETR
jgi:hypothetical protein